MAVNFISEGSRGVPVENNLFCHSIDEEELSNFYLS
jgi:hypothetical protein